jgi:choice-of-anchor A domain-containing protein
VTRPRTACPVRLSWLVAILLLALTPDVARAGLSAPCGPTPSAVCIMQTYNVVLGNLSTGSDIEGSVVVGGDMTASTLFNNTSRLPTTPVAYLYGQLQDSINIDNGGSLNYGSLAHGVTLNLSGGASATQGNWPDPSVTAFTNPLNSKSAALSLIAGDANVALSGGHFVISAASRSGARTIAADSGLAYVSLTASQLETLLTSFSGAPPTFSFGHGIKSVIFNISGTPAAGTDLGSGLNLDANVYQNILFNFYQATSLQLNSWSTAVLAPDATVTLDGSAFDGFLYADNLSAGAEVHNFYYTGYIRTPEPGTLSLLAVGLAAVAGLRRARRPAAVKAG